MGRLLQKSTGRSWPLAGEQLVGRAADCALCIHAQFISSRHAQICWREGRWTIKDLDSKNGTFVNGERLKHNTRRALRPGDQLAFGDVENEIWELTDAGEPRPLVVPLDGEPPLVISEQVLALPADAPEAMIWEDQHGCWWLEPMDRAAIALQHGSVFEVHGVRYRFSADEQASTTQAVRSGYDLDSARLQIRHSLDEEYVEAFVEVAGAEIALGERQHHAVLLTLARQRLDDRAQGVPEGSCGWLYVEELMERLKIDRTHLNLQIYRIRKQFFAASFRNAEAVVERRVQTRQVRLRFREVVVSAL